MRLLFLGKLADLAGGQEFDVAGEPLDWPGLRTMLEHAFGADLARGVTGPEIRIALDGAVLADKTSLSASANSEIAFLPPVSGG